MDMITTSTLLPRLGQDPIYVISWANTTGLADPVIGYVKRRNGAQITSPVFWEAVSSDRLVLGPFQTHDQAATALDNRAVAG